MDKVTIDKKTELALKIKDQIGKGRAFLADNMTTGLTVVTLFGLGAMCYFAWKEIPKAQAEVKRKKEVDPNATDLEITAAAASKMKGFIIATAVTGGCVIANKLISDSRLAAATAFGAAAFSDKKAIKKELDKLRAKHAVANGNDPEKKTEGENAAEPFGDVDIIEGDTVQPDMAKKQEMLLNKLYKCVIDWNEREIKTTPLRVSEINEFIRKTYGATAANSFVGKSFSLNTVMNLFGEHWGTEGDILGYRDGDHFQISVAPAMNARTGEIFMQIYMTEPDVDWETL